MREALLAVGPEEAEHFKVTKEAHQEEIWCEKIARNCRAEP